MPIVDPNWPRADVWLASDRADADVVVVGVPNSRSSLSASRADLAALVVRDRLARFSTFHGELDLDIGSVAVRDLGNWPVSELDPVDLDEALKDLASSLPDASLTIFLGGDNAITRPLAASMADDLTTVGVITFDAHHDVRTLTNGPTNGNPIRRLIEEDGLPGRNVVQIGIHSFANSADYRKWVNDNGIAVVTVADVDREGMEQVIDDAFSRLDQCDVIYVDVDVDVLDSAFAPACPGARPGGFTIRQLSDGVRLAAERPKTKRMDFVEVDPEADRDFRTMDVMAHLFLTAVAGFATRS